MKINNWLTLLEEDAVQKNWYLVLGGNAPTIEQYKRKPESYNTIPHGLYKIEIYLADTWVTDDGICVGKECGLKVAMNSRQVFVHQVNGSVELNGTHLTITGRFEKQGRVIFFKPGK